MYEAHEETRRFMDVRNYLSGVVRRRNKQTQGQEKKPLHFAAPEFRVVAVPAQEQSTPCLGEREARVERGRDMWGACCARRERPRGRSAAERGYQFPPSDGDCHTPLPREVRKGNDTTRQACCPNSAAPGAGEAGFQAGR